MSLSVQEATAPGGERSSRPVLFVRVSSGRRSRGALAAKRIVDLVVACLALVLTAPLFAVIALTIKLDSRGPVFFRQLRVGAGDRTFRILKFRTMVEGAHRQRELFAHLNSHARRGDARLFKISGDPRITRVGSHLRRRFVDELPQLVNVLRGDMSLVGCRPLVPEEDAHVTGRLRRRLELRPGMTGVWQTLGHSAIHFEDMVELDCLYVIGWSFRSDLRILARTLPLVLRGGGKEF